MIRRRYLAPSSLEIKYAIRALTITLHTKPSKKSSYEAVNYQTKWLTELKDIRRVEEMKNCRVEGSWTDEAWTEFEAAFRKDSAFRTDSAFPKDSAFQAEHWPWLDHDWHLLCDNFMLQALVVAILVISNSEWRVLISLLCWLQPRWMVTLMTNEILAYVVWAESCPMLAVPMMFMFLPTKSAVAWHMIPKESVQTPSCECSSTNSLNLFSSPSNMVSTHSCICGISKILSHTAYWCTAN